MGQNLKKTTRGSGFPGVSYWMKLLLYLGLKGQGREWFLEDGKWSTMERIMKRWHQPTAIRQGKWGKDEDINLTLLQLSSVPLIGQTQLEVKEEDNSLMQSMNWALRGQSKFRRHREGQMEQTSHSEESRLSSRFVTWAPRRIELPFTEMEENLGAVDLGKNTRSTILDILH